MLQRRSGAVILLELLVVLGAPAYADPRLTAQFDVSLIDAADRPIADAEVDLEPERSKAASNLALPGATITVGCDSRGRCASDDIPSGTYFLTVRTASIVVRLDEPVVVSAGRSQRMLIRVSAAAAIPIATLGTLRITPTGTLSTNSAPVAELSAQALAQRGEPSVVQSLAAQPGVTLNRPAGGAPGLPVSIILRGSDPKETIIQVDGQPINNSSTGDFDVSLLDPSAFSNVQVLYGLAPASLVGANTEGGTINFHTLEPTSSPHGLLRYSFGSFVSNGYTMAATGSANKLGYALDLHSYNEQGEVNDYPVRNVSTGQLQTLGSGLSGTNMLAKFRYALGSEGMVEASVLTFGSNDDLSAALSTPANSEIVQPGAPFTSYAGSERSTVNTFYNADVRLPVGAAGIEGASADAFITARHMTSVARQTVSGPANGLTEYLLNGTDTINDNSLEFEHVLANTDLALVVRGSDERLTVPDQFGTASPTQTQASDYMLARYIWNGGARLRYTAAVYYSYFSTFGTSLDPRGAVVWTPTLRTVVRASIGTGFQAPLLSEKIIPSPLPPPDVNGLIFVGNPNLTADHTTEYELDAEQFLGAGANGARGELDLYRANERGDDLQFIPVGASPSTPKLSYPINVTTSVSEGVALQLTEPLSSGTVVSASYNINAAYPLELPTSLIGAIGNIVPFQQSQSIPLHRATLSLRQQKGELSWMIGMAYEGQNNDLNQPPFALVNANVKYALGHTDVVVAANNLTDIYAGRFTLAGVGVPYPGLTALIPTDAFQLQAPSVTVTITQHW